MKKIVSFKNFSYTYPKNVNPTLKNITLDIYEGEKILIVGKSGCGKSTLTKCINGLISSNVEVATDSIGTILQDSDTQFVARTVLEDIAFILENNKVEFNLMKKKVNKILQLIDMKNFLNNKPQDLSGGQKQKVALAGILIDEVNLLLFDEPLANLDPRSGQSAIEQIKEIYNKTKCTIIMVEHRIEDVLSLGIDKIVLIDAGEIIACDSVENILNSSVLEKYGIREPLDLVAKRYLSNDNFYKIYEESKLPNTKKLISLENVNFKYDENNYALKNITFDIYEGEMISIVGKNGAGKSTIAKLICGFETDYTGDIIYNGENIKNYNITQRGELIGYVMQNPNHMISQITVKEEVEFSLKLKKINSDIIDKKVEKILKLCGLYKFRNWPISKLSYGQKKRVTIASILVLDPKILILDEPTAAQDYTHYKEIMEFLRELNEKHGITMIMVTHDMHLMIEYTTRALVMKDGELIYQGSCIKALMNEKIMEEANLNKTSLNSLAKKLNLDEYSFIRSFIDYERNKK